MNDRLMALLLKIYQLTFAEPVIIPSRLYIFQETRIMIKIKILLTTIILVCFAALALAGAKNQISGDPGQALKTDTAPKAVATETEYAFDEVVEGEVITHAYPIENHGDAPLKILDVRTSCGCTTAKRPDTIAPNARDQIIVKGNTSGYGGGNFNKTITVFTNDPNQSEIRLHLSGPVAFFARIEPPYISLKGSTTEQVQAEATITQNPKHPFRITAVELDHRLDGKIDVQLEEQKAIYRLKVRNLIKTPGSYQGRIIFKTDNTAHPKLSMYMRGRIQG